jgi:hypothetical protein
MATQGARGPRSILIRLTPPMREAFSRVHARLYAERGARSFSHTAATALMLGLARLEAELNAAKS